MHLLKKYTTSFARDEQGAVAILFGLAIIALMLISGIAVDSARFHNVSSKIQDSLDASALAAAKLLPDETASDADIEERAQAYFNHAIASAGVQLTSLEKLELQIDRGNASIAANLSATVPSLFGGLAFQPKTAIISQSSKVVFDMKKVEVALVLDITGSMNSSNKLADLKTAAKEVVEELYNASLSENGVRIALAPYSASVNAGEYASAVTNVPPTTTCARQYHEWKCKDVAGVDQDTCVVERQGANAATDAAPVGSDKLPNVASPAPSGYTCPSATVLGLRGKSQEDEVKATIDSYSASGATAGHIGTAWGWYLLSPEWAGVLGPSAPKDYGEDDVQKTMVIMTDGLFNRSYLTANADTDTQSNESYAQFDALCSGAKAKNITIFTVGFDLSDSRALTELAGCASSPENFFDAKTGADLKAAFKAIAEKLNTLRVAS